VPLIYLIGCFYQVTTHSSQFSPGGFGVYDVTTFGALSNGSDAAPGIQAAVDASCKAKKSTIDHPAVYLPKGTFIIHRPIVITCNHFELFGQSRTGSAISPDFGGPAILLTSDTNQIPLENSLVGSDNSFIPTKQTYFNLRDIPTVELNGLSQFTVEAFFKVTQPTPDQGYIVSSYGKLGNFQGTSAFTLAIINNHLRGSFTLNHVVYSIIQTDELSITLNQVHHVAMTYDGAKIKLFLDGSLIASTNATGSITQDFTEEVTVGAMVYGLEANIVGAPIVGSIDSVRLSKIVRYSNNFSVSRNKFATDNNTLALLNFEQQLTGLTLAYSGLQKFWLPIRASTPFQGGVNLHNFTVSGGMGIVGINSTVSHLYQINCLDCDYGLFMTGNNYVSRFNDIYASAGKSRGRYGILSVTANGNSYNNITLIGQRLPLVLQTGAQEIVTNITINPGKNTIFGALVNDGFALFNGITIQKPSLNSVWKGGIISTNSWGRLQIQKGVIGNATGGYPIIIDGGQGALIQGTEFKNSNTAPEILHVVKPSTSKNILINLKLDNPKISWTNDLNALILAKDFGLVPDPAIIPPSFAGNPVLLGQVAPANVWDVSQLGADASGIKDSYLAIQTTIDKACSKNGGLIILPEGNYSISQPIRINCNNIALYGASHNVQITPIGHSRPSIILNPPGMTGVDLVPSLVGTGKAMKTNGGSYWIGLRDAPSMELDGLSNFTAEAFVKLTAPKNTGYAGILQSHGCLGSGGTLPGCTSAFRLGTMDRKLYATLNVKSSTYVLQGPELPLKKVLHLALTYDGAVIRLFLNGKLVTSQEANGTLTQGFHEDVTAGPETVGFDADIQNPAVIGVLDSLRLSKTARYTTNFAIPIKKFSSDKATIALLNFDQNPAGLTVIEYGSRQIWTAIRRTAEPDGTPETTISGTKLKGFKVSGNGIFGMNATLSEFDQITSIYTDLGIMLLGNSSKTIFNNVYIMGGNRGRYGILTVYGDQNIYHSVVLNYHRNPLIIYGGKQQNLSNVLLSPVYDLSYYGSLFIRSGITINGFYFDNEGNSDNWKGNMVIVEPIEQFQLFKGEIDSMKNQGTPITLDGGESLLVEGTSFGSSKMDSEIIHLNAPTRSQNIAVGVSLDSGTKLSDDINLLSIGN